MDQISNPQAAEQVQALVAWAASHQTDVANAMASKWAMDTLAAATTQLSQVRVVAVRSLWASGWSLADIHEALGLSRARIHQIIEK